MRWKKFVGGLALSLTVATGCKQPVFMNADDYQAVQTIPLPKDLETNQALTSITPDVNGKLTRSPATILDPEREVHFLSLTEAVARALENGHVGNPPQPSLNGISGIEQGVNPVNVTDNGFGAARASDSIRVLALEPAVDETNIEGALSKFDARWVTAMSWNTTDRPVGTALDQFQTAGQASVNTQAAELRSTLFKPLPTGGYAGITFDVPYQYTNLGARVNPSYTPSVQFGFEQPLLQNFGVEINELRNSLPQSLLFGGQATGTPGVGQSQFANEGILIARINLDQQRATFELSVQNMKLNVETAYWNLYAAYGQLYAREIALRKNLEIWRLTRERVEAGVKTFTLADLYETQGQYESSRSDWLAALGSVLERERNLRGLLGLPAEDGKRLVPSDAPTLAPYRPNWELAQEEALLLKPELVLDREQLKANQLNIVDWKNRLLPDLRFFSTYDLNGIGTRLDGPDINSNALRDMASNHFNNFSLGLRLDVPLGFRDANAGLRQAQLRLAQMYWKLRTDEDKVSRNLALQYRDILEFQEQIQRNLSAVEAYNNELNVRIQRVRGGTDTPDVTLQAIRFGAAALVQYYAFVGQYNTALASFEHAKGTILRANNIVIADGPLPPCAQVRAVEHEEERTKALILRERAAAVPCDGAGGPAVPTEAAPAAPQAAAPPPKPELLNIAEWLRTGPSMPAEFNNTPTSLPAPKTLDQLGPAKSATSLPFASPTATPAVKPAPGPGSTSSFGVVKPLQFPDDMKVPGALPALSPTGAGDGTR